MTQSEILTQFKQMTPRQQQALLQKLQKAAQTSAATTSVHWGARRGRGPGTAQEPKLLSDDEKKALRARVQEELGAYRLDEESEEQRRKRLEAIPALEGLRQHGQGLERGMLRRMGLPPLTDEEVEGAIAKRLTEKYLK